MASVKVFLFKTPAHSIFLTGDESGQEVALNSLRLPNNEEFKLSTTITLPKTSLTEDPAGSGEYKFKKLPESLKLESALEPVTLAFTLFGKAVNAAAEFNAKIAIQIPGTDAAPQPFLALEFCASLALEGGGFSVITDPFCYQITLDKLPDFDLPDIELPKLNLRFPNFGVRLPRLRIPWNFPNLPKFPFTLPAFTLPHASLPLKLSWKAIKVDLTDQKLIVDIEHLKVEGKVGAIEADVHLVFDKNGLILTESYIHFYRPDFNHKLKAAVSNWHFDDDCLVLQWQAAELNQWLQLLSPDLADKQVAAGIKVSLRLMWSGDDLNELRFDWEAPGALREIDLPGFEITIPPAEFYSLIVRRDAGDNHHLAVIATFDAVAEVKAESTFTLTRREDRELHNDEKQKGKPLIFFSASPSKDLSFVLMDFPLNASGPTFFKQFDAPLAKFDFANKPALCLPANFEPISLRAADWDQPKLEVDKDQIKDFALPFLKKDPSGKKDEGGNPANDSQFIKLTGFTPKAPDFTTHTVGCDLDVKVMISDLVFETSISLLFDWERFAFAVSDDQGIKFKLKKYEKKEFLGLTWLFTPGADDLLFILATKDGNFQLKQAPGSKVEVLFTKATSKEQPIIFAISDFALTGGGVSVTARVTDSPARLNGLNTQFRFTEGVLQIRENRIAGFTIAGSGPLPPALVGNAIADISLQFGERSGGLELLAGAAQLRGSKLLKCQGTRFQFSIDGIGLKFVNDGRYHLYFTLTGKARFVPFASDDSSGPLALLSAIELQLIECPLTGDASTLAKHIKFLIELPKKVTFDFMGCFKMELRGIAFLPQFDNFSDKPAAMEISGQLKFADSAGDVIDARIDFHNLVIALPKPGSFIPRIHFKGLGVKLKVGEAFDLSGAVDFFDNEDIGQGLIATGFSGEGSLAIQGLPQIAASFSFLRVSRDGGQTWQRAWFIYIEARKLSLRIPIIEIFIREVGLGFGYRYTLVSIKESDTISDPKKLIKTLQGLSKTQGNLSRRDQWRVDLEEPGESTRFTIALRALISQTSAAAGIADWNEKVEETLPCLFLIDAVIALRSDLTFLMTVRGWLATNYHSFLNDKNSVKDHPLVSGFALLSPRQKRFLAHFASNQDATFGDNPPLPPLLKDALKNSRFSATLLIEPNLFHLELGWPNQLQWKARIGPLEAEFRGGQIFRVSNREIVIGQSYMARGTLDISAEINLGIVGARLSARASVAYGARYIGVIGIVDPVNDSALYGGIGLEIHVAVSIEFWIRIKLLFAKITLRFRFSFSITFTALLEVGITFNDLVGARGTGTVSLRIMGHNLHFSIHVGLNEKAVDRALQLTNKFLTIGLEATEVEPIPGTPGAQAVAAREAFALALNVSREAIAEFDAQAAKDDEFNAPNYTIFSIPAGDVTYFVLLPSGEQPAGETELRFLPVPPDDGNQPAEDFNWQLPANGGAKLSTFDRTAHNWGAALNGANWKWQVNWDRTLADGLGKQQQMDQEDPNFNGAKKFNVTVRTMLRHAFLTKLKDPNLPDDPNNPQKGFENVIPLRNPELPQVETAAMEDARVHHQADDAVEAAVRGAAQQFEGSPYLKRDKRSLYEQTLSEAFDPGTTVYTTDGKVPKDPASAEMEEMQKTQQTIQLRGVVVRQLITDLQEYVALATETNPNQQKINELVDGSLAFQMGLVFRLSGGTPDWLKGQADAGKIQQRFKRDSATADSTAMDVRPFNTTQTRFDERPPQFQRVQQYADANTVAVAWDLIWPEVWTNQLQGAQKEPEHHLMHYLVRRRALAGGEREAEFTIKHVEVLNRPAAQGGNVLERLRSRFQLVDHFNQETAEDQAALPVNGKSYIYTITPIDVAGIASSRPLTIVATRYPNQPPQVPVDGELIVKYRLGNFQSPETVAMPQQPEDMLTVRWTQPLDSQNGPRVGIDRYRLVFRKETAFPVGSYGFDAESEGSRSNGLPVSNARPLRTDIFIEWDSSPAEVRFMPDENGQPKLEHDITLQQLRDAGIFPRDGETWRPDSWRAFFQTKSAGNVYSSLAPIRFALQFCTDSADRLEDRRPPQLEWIAKPVRFDTLPPEDEKGEAGDAYVPMPKLDQLTFSGDSLDQSFEFRKHPEKLRCVKFEWNQGPSGNSSYPVDLHAGYQLYEFDLDAHTAEVLDTPPADFLDRLRRIQELVVLSPENLKLTPADNLTANQWEAWYPSVVRRLELREKAGEAIPPQRSEAVLSPWHSWRESYLVWPDDKFMFDTSAVFQPDRLKGVMSIDGVTQTINKPSGGFGIYEAGQYIRIAGAADPLNNGIKRVETVSDTALKFEAGSFTVPSPETEKDRTLDLNGEPFSALHPYLAKLLDDVSRRSGHTLDLNPPPPALQGKLSTLLGATPPPLDPCGWNILKRMGLSATFALRRADTGQLVDTGHTLELLSEVINSYPEAIRKRFHSHLHIEHLFQPARSMRLPQEQAEKIETDQLLALVQVSLRPAIQQALGYAVFEVTRDAAILGDNPKSNTVQISVLNGNAPCRFIEQTEHNVAPPQTLAASAVEIKREIIPPPSGKTLLIFQAADITKVKVQVAGKDVAAKLIAPTDWLAGYFDVPAGLWPQQLAEKDFGKNDANVAAQWERFKRYVLRINPPNPADPAAPKVEFPKADDSNGIAELLAWTQRFFDFSGDVKATDGIQAGLSQTGDGPWLASAYQRAVSPVGVTPDSASRLRYYHPIEDQWAHVYRYYVLPSGRYDKLWESLAQSNRLFKEPEQRLANLNKLREFQPPADGGLDIALDRIRNIAPPLVLFSGRLDPKSAPAEPAPPGKTWEVIVAKHHEQDLSERNRTVARQLAYRQLSHTLLRRFAFAAELQRFQDALLRDTTSRAFAKDEAVAALPAETIQLTVEGVIAVISLKDKNTLAGLAETINNRPPLQAGNKQIRLKAEVIEPAPDKFHLAVTPSAPVKIELRTSLGGENLFGQKFKQQINLKLVEGPAPQTLPGAYDAPDHINLQSPSPEELRTIDLPERLNTFSQGAMILQWEALPYFYEHRLLLVAQSSTTVSSVTSVTQRDFEYIAPQPTALVVGVASAIAGTRNRDLLLRIRLDNYWNCLPVDAQARWQIEAPHKDDDQLRKLSSLPDTEVSYQLILARDGGVIETQADFLFDLRHPSGYQVRQLGQKLTAVPQRIVPPGLGDQAQEPFFLEARLSQQRQVSLPGQELLVVKGDFERVTSNLLLLTRLFNAHPLPKPSPQARPEEINRYVNRWYATARVSRFADNLSPELVKKIEFVLGRDLVFWLCLREPLNQAERNELLHAYPAQADQLALNLLFTDMDYRQAVERFLADWVSEEPVGSRVDFPEFNGWHDRVEFVAPLACSLALEGTLTPEEGDELLTLADKADIGFATAARQLVERMAARKTTVVEAGIGLEQITELSGLATAPTADRPELVWRGAISETQFRALLRWTEISPFAETFAGLLEKAAILQLSFDFDPEGEDPPGNLPPILQLRLRIEGSRIVWTGLLLRLEEEVLLVQFINTRKPDSTLRKALEALLRDLQEGGAQSRVGVAAQADWQPRPRLEDFSPGLREKLLIGNGRLRFYGWMTEGEFNRLQHDQAHPNKQAIARLFTSSMRAGLEGARLRIQSRRASAKARSSEVIASGRTFVKNSD